MLTFFLGDAFEGLIFMLTMAFPGLVMFFAASLLATLSFLLAL